MTNDSYQAERLRMVDSQLAARGIRDEAVLEAFRKIPRHLFVPVELTAQAYRDAPLPVGDDQTISQPYMAALMLELAHLSPGCRVLEVGTGSGYQTAILAELACEVYSIERLPTLAAAAQRRLLDLGWASVSIRWGDGTLGWPEHAPYHAIIVSAGGIRPPQPLLEQLAVQGRLVIPLQAAGSQVLTIVVKTASGYRTNRHATCSFVPLIGEHAWEE